MKHFYTFLLAMLGMLPFSGKAQTIYPVQATLQLLPPYSVYLTDYAQPGNEKLRVILLQRDLSQATYQLRLIFSVELNGRVIMRTARGYNPPPLTLDPGVPTIISGTDLASYLDSRNLDFVGYSKEQYEKTRALPEGSYRICISAYDYRRQDVPVAQEACSYYYLAKSEPPLLNYPSCGTKIPAKAVQQVIFSWLPRSTSSANSAAHTEYEFSLYEMRPAGRNINDVVLTSKPIYQVTTEFTQLVYGPLEPQLLENMQYVWRVQARDREGKDMFRNNGFSEVCSFIYGGVDPAFVIGQVKDFKAQAQTERKATFSWKTEPKGFESYRLAYKKAGTGYEWFRTDTKEGELKVYDLEPDTEYEARVQGQVKGVYGPPTDILTFRTPKSKIAVCGENIPVTQLQQGKPLAFATKGMIINARGMEVILEQVVHLSEDGFYKGRGLVAIPYLGGANFHVRFERIYIDEDRNVVSGRIDVVSDKEQMTDVLNWTAEVFSPLTEKLDELLTNLQEPEKNKEALHSFTQQYATQVEDIISANPQLPDSIQILLRKSAAQLDEPLALAADGNSEALAEAMILTSEAKHTIEAVAKELERKQTITDKITVPCIGPSEYCGDIFKQLAAIKSARENGQSITIISPPKVTTKICMDNNLIIDGTEYQEIRIICELPQGSKTTINPNYYESYHQTFLTSDGSDLQEGFVLKNDKNILAKILIIDHYDLLEDKKKALEAYLFGECNFIRKLEQIHTASSWQINSIMTFTNDCQRSANFKNITINNIFYDNLYCSFDESVAKGESFPVASLKYKEIEEGFELYLGNRKIFWIHYLKDKKNESIYASNKSKLKEWLFKITYNSSNISDGSIIAKATEQDYIDYAKNAGIKDINAFKAFTIVESSGNAFFEYNGLKIPVLLYERHLMYKCLRDKKIWSAKATTVDPSIDVDYLASINPGIVHSDGYYYCQKCDLKKYPDTYTKKVEDAEGKYTFEDCKENGKTNDWFVQNCYSAMTTTKVYEKRYLEAVKICKECAIMATSWGVGQVIGANFRNKYKSVDEMEKDIFNGGEKFQLLIMSEFIKSNSNLKNAINDKDWSSAASIYNGPKYKVGNYDGKLKNEYEALSNK